MKITLKSLTLEYFKGIKHMNITFDPISTLIKGENGTGKTTIFDAFLWLFFDKDSAGKTEFNIKTLKEDGEPYHQVDHTVAAVIDVDGEEVSLRKIYREKWQKKRGSAQAEFTGHEQQYFFNETPCNQKEYMQKVGDIINEDIFRLITSPTYFPSPRYIKWQDAREVLFRMAGDVSHTEVSEASDGKFAELLAMLNSRKTMEDLRKEIASKKKLINSEIETIPLRIDELTKSMPESADWSLIEDEITRCQTRVVDIESQIADKSKASQAIYEKRQSIQKEYYALLSELQALRHNAEIKATQDANNANEQYSQSIQRLKQLDEAISSYTKQKESYEAQAAVLRQKIEGKREEGMKEIASELNFDEKDFCCPTCKRAYDVLDVEAKREELVANFNKSKSERIAKINSEGKALKEELESAERNADAYIEKIAESNTEKQAILACDYVMQPTIIPSDEEIPGIPELVEKIAKIKEILDTPIETVSTTDLETTKKPLVEEIDRLKRRLYDRTTIEKTEARIAELLEKQQSLAQELSAFEETEFMIYEFMKAKVDLVEQKVNSLFKIVKYKLFETQVNGQEIPCCIATVNGVPYQDLNNAMKINAGIDIINAMTKYYGKTAPIFIDNRESVNRLIETQSQVINLVVSSDPIISINQH